MTTAQPNRIDTCFATPYGNLYDYATGEYLRAATAEQVEESAAGARRDGTGVIMVDGRNCYAI